MEEASKVKREAAISSRERNTNQGSGLCHFYICYELFQFRLVEESCETWFLRCENSSRFIWDREREKKN